MNDAALVLNPYAKLVAERSGDSLAAVRVVAPIKGRHVTTTTFFRDDRRTVTEFLWGLVQGQPDLQPELDERELGDLVGAGLLVAPDAVPEMPRFSVPLAIAPEGEAALDESWMVHPDLRACSTQELPAVFAAGSVVQVPHLATRVSLPVWLDADTAAALTPGEAPRSLSPRQRSALRRAGVLVSAAEVAARRASFAELGVEPRARFAENAYWVVRGLIPGRFADALADHYRRVIAEGFMHFKDQITESVYSTRFVKHQEPVAVHVHGQLAALVSQIAGKPVKPSYAFVSSYEPGAELARHVDRAQCEYSLSLQVGYAPDRNLSEAWPIYLDTPAASQVPVSLRVGDALLYRGRQLPHYRYRLPEGHRSIHIFFHFVDQEFDAPLG